TPRAIIPRLTPVRSTMSPSRRIGFRVPENWHRRDEATRMSHTGNRPERPRPRPGDRLTKRLFSVATLSGLLALGVGVATAPSAQASAPTWSATGSMSTGRAAQTATLLPNGTVLAAGGFTINANGF